LASAVLWHALAVLSPGWVQTSEKQNNGRDFASYFYAVRAAEAGADPYDKRMLAKAARRDGSRRSVHPFFYPPPFLLAMAWALPLDLHRAYQLWFWLDELAALAAVLALWGWWRRLGDTDVAVLAIGSLALMTAVPNNHVMGQMNFPALALALGGLWATDRGWKAVGGGLLGAACMWKMSPALLVAWWLIRREWVAVAWACATAAVLTLAAVPLVSLEHQVRFYTEVLPKFGSGDYNGLSVPIDLFGNHSVPNLWNELSRSDDLSLTPLARGLSSLTTLSLVAGLGWAFRRPDPDLLQTAAQVGAVGVVMLLLPVYTYEHHLVWSLPAVVAVALAVRDRRLGPGWVPLVAFAVVVLAFDLQDLKALRNSLPRGPLMGLVQELKFVALVVLGAAATVVGASSATHRDTVG
jgi:alpha-1,2-mannosyltransferase